MSTKVLVVDDKQMMRDSVGSTLQRADILSYVRTTVDIVLQLSRDATGRHVSGISVGG